MKYIRFMPEPEQLFIGAMALVVAVLIVVVFTAKKSNGITAYEPINQGVLTKAEQQFYKSLSFALQEHEVLIFSKVRLADLVRVKKSIKKKHWWGYFSKIGMKHIDFIIIDKSSFKTLAAIELDDKSHDKRERQTRDKFVNQVMAQTGIALYRFKVKRTYDKAEIVQTLQSCLNFYD